MDRKALGFVNFEYSVSQALSLWRASFVGESGGAIVKKWGTRSRLCFSARAGHCANAAKSCISYADGSNRSSTICAYRRQKSDSPSWTTRRKARTLMRPRRAMSPRSHRFTAVRNLCALGSRHVRSSSLTVSSSSSVSDIHSGVGSDVPAEDASWRSEKSKDHALSPKRIERDAIASLVGFQRGRRLTLSWAENHGALARR